MGIISDNQNFITDASSGAFTVNELVAKYKFSWTGISRWAKKRNIALKCDRPSCFNTEFFFKETPEMAYVLGWFAADGCVRSLRGQLSAICLRLKKTDHGMLEKIKRLTGFTSDLMYGSQYDSRTKKEYEYCMILFNSKHVLEHLAKYDIRPRKSLDLEFPSLPDDLYPHYIRGYLDGDGYISKIRTRPGCTVGFCGPAPFLEALRAKLRSLIGEDVGSVYAHGKISKLEFRGMASTRKILDVLYENSTEDTRLDRKYDLYVTYYPKLPPAREVNQLSPNTGNVIATFSTCTEAATHFGGKNGSSIAKCCTGQFKTAYGYKWVYAGE
jgi:hypothetical protein